MGSYKRKKKRSDVELEKRKAERAAQKRGGGIT
jgi:hypothetical protein